MIRFETEHNGHLWKDRIAPSIAMLEATVAFALEGGNILRDPSRRDSHEFVDYIARKASFMKSLNEMHIDLAVIDYRMNSVPPEMYGETKSEVPFKYDKQGHQSRRVETVLVARPSPAVVMLQEIPVMLREPDHIYESLEAA